MKSNKLAKNSLAVGLVTLIITAGLSFSANGADDPVAQARASAVKGTGLFELLDGEQCEAIVPGGTAGGAGKCGEGLDTNSIDAYSQHATAANDGNSAADATVAPIDALDLHTTLDLTDLISDLADTDTGSSVLDAVVGDLAGGALKTLLLTILGPVTDAVDSVLQTALTGVDDSLPISLKIGTVEASATAEPGSAQGSSSIVGGLHLIVDLGGQKIEVPLTAGTAPNSNLLIGAPQDLVDGILDGIRDSLDASLGGALNAINPLLTSLEDQLIDPLLDALEPTLLTGVADLLEPVISGTVNRQIPVSPSSGELDVTALHLEVLGAGNTLDLARVHVGPNAGPAADDNDTNADVTDADSTDEQADSVSDSESDSAADADSTDEQADTVSDSESDSAADADSAADSDAASDADADADVNQTLPDTGAPNLAPLWILGLAFVLFGSAILVNEKRRTMQS